MGKLLQKTKEKIEEFGYTVIAVFPESDKIPGFTYTVGLTKTYNHPELIVFGLNPQTAATLLHISIFKIIEENEITNKIKIDHIYKDIATLPLKFKTVKQELAEEYLTMHKKQKLENLQALQMIWPDEMKIFPGQDGYDQKFVDVQPLLF